MQISKINCTAKSPNFQAKIIMTPEVLKVLTSKEFDRTLQNEYLSLSNFQYTPLEQRMIIYNILKHIKKDKTHREIEIGGGYWMANNHTVHMSVDGNLEHWNEFPEYSKGSLRSDYSDRIHNFAEQIYPNINFRENTLLKSLKYLFVSERYGYAKLYEQLAKKIEKLVTLKS